MSGSEPVPERAVPESRGDASADAARAPADLRLVPVAVAVWLALLVVLSGTVWLITTTVVVVAGLLVVGVVVGLARRSSLRSGRWRWLLLSVAVAAAVALGVGGVRERQLTTSLPARLAAEQAVAVIELQTVGDPERFAPSLPGRSELVRVPARTRTVSARGKDWRVLESVTVLVTGDQAGAWTHVPAGSRLRVTGRFVPADPGTGIGAVVRIRGPSVVLAEPSAGWRLTGRIRSGLRDAVATLPADRRALVPALVVGDTSAMTDDLDDAFRASGLSHLNAVSGANLALMLAFVLTVARWLGVRGWWLRIAGAGCVVAFVAICRTEPSVLRAAAMGVVVLAGLGFAGRGPRSVPVGDPGPDRGANGLLGSPMVGFRPLALAAIVLLLLDPWLCRSAGFALSVLATAGIVALARRWTDVATASLPGWVPRWLVEAITVPLSAQITTQPVVTALSGQVSLVGIVANALAGPCVGPATVLGFATALVSLGSPVVAALLGWAAGWPAQVIIWIARTSAGLPGAVLHLPVGPAVVGVVTLVSILVGWVIARVLARPWIAAGLLAAMIVILLRPPIHPGWPPPDWVVVACDVGQGDALVIDLGDRAAAVIDTGPEPEPVDRCLDSLGITSVPLLVLTHFHADHVGGLTGVLSGRRVGLVLVSPLASPAVEAATVHRLVAAAPGARIESARVGARLDVGRLHWLTVGPVRPAGRTDDPAAAAEDAESSAQNDGSIVGVASIDLDPPTGAPLRVLFTGDVEPDGQQAILATGAELAVDVLKVPHHGSSRQDQAFLAATGARVAVTSSGIDNSYGHPAASTVRRLEQLGMVVLRTDQHGGIALWVEDGRLGATAQR